MVKTNSFIIANYALLACFPFYVPHFVVLKVMHALQVLGLIFNINCRNVQWVS